MSAKAETYTMYRGFILQLTIRKKRKGEKIERSARASVEGFLPELKADSIDDFRPQFISELTLRDGEEIEYVSAGYLDGGTRTSMETLNHSTVDLSEDSESEALYLRVVDAILGILFAPIIEDDGPAASFAQLVSETLSIVEGKIDNYIKSQQLTIDEDELWYGMNQELSEPVTDVEVSEPSFDDSTEYDEYRPDPDVLLEDLELETE